MLTKQHTIKTALLEAFPLALAIAAYGLSYGVLAIQAHWSLWSTIMMSVLVFSGSVQLMIIAMVISGATLPGMILTAVLLNLRNLLYGAALADNLAPASRKYRWLLAFGVSENHLYWEIYVIRSMEQIRCILVLYQDYFIAHG